MMNVPSLLLFDLGGVLIDSSVFQHLNRLLDKPLETSALKARWLSSQSVRQFESGAMTAHEFAESFIAEWGLRQRPNAFLRAFASWPRYFHPGAREVLGLLRTRCKIACLSNSNPLHHQRFAGFADVFDLALFSHQLGMVKPDPEIFAVVLRECGVEAAEVYFFDDCLFNVYAAQSLGMSAFHVDGFDALLAVLSRQGLLPGNRAVNPDFEVLENG